MTLHDQSVCATLLDIEGTTTPLVFVYKALFPYARSHLRQFLSWHLFGFTSDDRCGEIKNSVPSLRSRLYTVAREQRQRSASVRARRPDFGDRSEPPSPAGECPLPSSGDCSLGWDNTVEMAVPHTHKMTAKTPTPFRRHQVLSCII
jgi:hypothetical protein